MSQSYKIIIIIITTVIIIINKVSLKYLPTGSGGVLYIFNPSTWEVERESEAGRSL